MSHPKDAQDRPATADFKKNANHLKSLLQNYRPAPALGQCLDMLAQISGEKSWHVLKPKLDAIPTWHEMREKFNRLFTQKISKAVKEACLKTRLKPLYISPVFHPRPNEESKGEQTYRLGVSEQTLDQADITLTVKATEYVLEAIQRCNVTLSFPPEALGVAAALLGSKMVAQIDDINIRRYQDSETGREAYVLEWPFSMVNAYADPGQTVFDQPEPLDEFKESLIRYLDGLREVLDAHIALSGDWRNAPKRRHLEKTLWAYSSGGAPTYESEPRVFHRLEIGGHRFHASIYGGGPVLTSANGHVALGVCSIAYLDGGPDSPNPGKRGFYICKYDTQPQVALEGLSREQILQVSAEFGVPINHSAKNELGLDIVPGDLSPSHTFYTSPAFASLVGWVDTHRAFAKNIHKEALPPYLPQWYTLAVKAAKEAATR